VADDADEPDLEDLTEQEETFARDLVRDWIRHHELRLPLLLKAELEELLVDFLACGPGAVRCVKALYAGRNTGEQDAFIKENLDYLTREFRKEYGYKLQEH
jgi:hypothetical protein